MSAAAEYAAGLITRREYAQFEFPHLKHTTIKPDILLLRCAHTYMVARIMAQPITNEGTWEEKNRQHWRDSRDDD